MKKNLFLLILLAWIILPANAAKGDKNDPIRSQLKWMAPAAPSNDEGNIENIFIDYVTPDGQEHHIICELPWPTSADVFGGGDIEEEDINFDGIPDMQVTVGFFDGTGHNPMYMYYVWDVETHEFKELPDPLFIAPALDPESRSITNRLTQENPANRYSYTIYYQEYVWKGNQLELANEWSEDFSLEQE